ncbi:MAG TPA: enoyl-CoA hydratase-related protein [Gammaproteobacteria bacterium]|nr:enoyl-CoA hydratase-related protein [Gammaproteobacteria bacterium]
MSGTIHVSRPVAGVMLLALENPPANTLGREMRSRLLRALDEAHGDLDVRVAVITGRGRSFCGGADLREERDGASGGGDDTLAGFARLLDSIERLRVPVVAAINGACVGGGLELALCCDIRLASESARFVCAGVNVGLMASAWRLPRLIGIGPARHMLLTGLPQDAPTAERRGLVTGVYPDGELPDEALALAGRIASRAPLSVEATRRVSGQALDLEPGEAARVQARELSVLAASDDHREAVEAFLEKREPRFTRS